MILIESLRKIYGLTIDRSKFREIASRFVVFILPLLYWGRKPYWEGLILVFVGLMIRAWASGYLRKDEVMTQGGPYFLVRHPLYLGSCLLALGLIIALHHWFVTLAIGGVTLLTYWHTIRHEEENLVARFGDAYLEYCQKAGPLWPKREGLVQFVRSFRQRDRVQFSFQQYLINREYECLLGVITVFFLLYLGSR